MTDFRPEPPAESPTELTLTPEQARAAMARAAAVRVVSDRDRRIIVSYVALLGVVIGVVLALAWWTLSQDNKAGFIASFAGYAAAVGLLVAANSRARSAPRGFARVYLAGFLVTMSLYAVGIAWFTSRQWPAAGVFLPYCLLVALPCLLAAYRIDRLARR